MGLRRPPAYVCFDHKGSRASFDYNHISAQRNCGRCIWPGRVCREGRFRHFHVDRFRRADRYYAFGRRSTGWNASPQSGNSSITATVTDTVSGQTLSSTLSLAVVAATTTLKLSPATLVVGGGVNTRALPDRLPRAAVRLPYAFSASRACLPESR